MEQEAVRSETAMYGVWRNESALADDLRTRMEKAGKRGLRDALPAQEDASSNHADNYENGERASAKETDRTSPTAMRVRFVNARAGAPAFQTSHQQTGHYSSPMFLANLLIGMLALQLGYSIFAAVLTIKGAVSSPFALAHWGAMQTSLILAICLGFVAWTYRLYANLTAFGAEGLKHNAGWAAAFMVIPVVNLIMPYRIFSEIWAASHPDADSRNPSTWRGTRGDTVTVVWWFVFTMAFTISQVLGHFRSLVGMALFASPVVGQLAFAVSAALAIIVVWRLSVRQDDKQFVLRAAGAVA